MEKHVFFEDQVNSDEEEIDIVDKWISKSSPKKTDWDEEPSYKNQFCEVQVLEDSKQPSDSPAKSQGDQ